MAFMSRRDGELEIYVMDTDSTEGPENPSLKLTNNGVEDSSPQWSADGTRIVFQSLRDGDWEIYSMKPDGSGVRKLTNNSFSDDAPQWSPDSTRIAFGSYRDGNSAEVYVMNRDGSKERNLTRNAFDDSAAIWSPNGRKIAFRSKRNGGAYDPTDIWVMKADGTRQTLLVDRSEGDYGSYNLEWQPVP
jgi:Tol biopolymer transport system component